MLVFRICGVEMKRTWISGITAAAVIAVLTLFLGLQFQWLSEASEATRERMHKRVEEDTKRVAADFNREIQGAYFNFQADPVLLASGDASELRDQAHAKGERLRQQRSG